MKTSRHIAIADHLWDAFERIAEDMGTDRDALVNQAMHMFARLNGYVVPGAPEPPDEKTPRPAPPPVPPERADRVAVAERVLEEAERLERAMHEKTPPGTPTPSPRGLYIVREDGTESEVAKERFIIGRGRHCDLVVDSGKVSREHAVVFREGDRWFIEDLGSSNGTWFQRERISRRRIEDGDEYFICAERIRCALR